MAQPPHTRAEMRALYPVCQDAELTAGYRDTTQLCTHPESDSISLPNQGGIYRKAAPRMTRAPLSCTLHTSFCGEQGPAQAGGATPVNVTRSHKAAVPILRRAYA